jgi:broad specificity phosphatase PhoE
MRIGKSFVEDETRRAVLTELGRAYVGSMPRSRRGERGEEVRKRIEMWKASVETAQRTTVIVSSSKYTMGCMRHTEEDILVDNRLLGQATKIV